MSANLLITGATGFIGHALATRLQGGGGSLRLLVRDVDRARSSGLPAAALVAGSLDDHESLVRAVEGVDAVVHLAGLTRALSAQRFDEVNGLGTRRLVDAVVARAPSARFVLVSSLAAAGPSLDGGVSSAHPDECRPVSVYGRSKLLGERELLAGGAGLDWIVVRPPIVYGPHDDGTRLLFRQACAPVVPIPWRDRPLSLIHVDDLVSALVACLDTPEARGAFVPVEGPDRVDTGSLMRRVAAACGRRARTIRVPMVLPRAVAPLVDAVARLRRRPGFFNPDKMREASAAGWLCDPEPARRVLGFAAAVDTATGLRSAMERDPELARYDRARS